MQYPYIILYDQYPRDLAAISAGCGTGNYLIAVSDLVGKVTGVEVNEGMLVQAKRKTAHLANVDLHHGNILSLSFPDQQFDGVLCNQVVIIVPFWPFVWTWVCSVPPETPSPSVYLGRHWHHSHDKCSQAFSLCFCILQAIKNWMVGRPWNEARYVIH